MENLFNFIVEYLVMIIYFISLIIILYGTIMSVKAMFIKTEKTPGIYIGESLDLSLRYLMITEVLHSFTSSTIASLIHLGLLLAIRVAIVVFNQKELEHEISAIDEISEEECECHKEKVD